MKNLPIFAAALLSCISLTAQTAKAPESVAEVNVSIPKPGMTQQWEQGRRRHSDFHRAQKDTWTVLVYQIVSGESSGSYISVQPGRSWKDYDGRAAFDKLDTPDVEKNMGPYQASGPRSFYVYRPDLSRTKEGGPPAKMVTATNFWVVPEHVRDFQEAIKAVNAGIDRVKYPAKPSRWYQLASGGETPLFVLITDRTGWADMESPATTLDEALSPDGAQSLATLRRASKRISTEILEFRPDLSYMPESAPK
jgi:hypothetical protein